MLGVHVFFGLMTVAIIVSVGDARSPQRIRGGEEAQIGDFPYQVSIRIKGQHICGGAILDKQYIITAAHCVADLQKPFTELRVATGSRFSFGGQTYGVQSVISHAGYDMSEASSPHDIAIIKLKEALTLGEKLDKIRLPNKDAVGQLKAVATGWGSETTNQKGSTWKLMKVNLTTLGFKECQKHFKKAILQPHQICTFDGVGNGVCQGDSGGPLVCEDVLIGIVSYGIPCGIGYPDVYTNVYHYRKWINDTIASM